VPVELPQARRCGEATIARDPALVRAMALVPARSRWLGAARMGRRAVALQRHAAPLCGRGRAGNGWFDRAVFSLGKQPEETRMYTLRFPLHHDATIRREAAKNGLDPAWVAAEIRAESVFDPNARSGANAMGLMQVCPATAWRSRAASACRGMAWRRCTTPTPTSRSARRTCASCYDKYGPPYMVLAGYNAGPAPLARWQAQRPGMDPDFWIETISYKETREYVARVLAFSVFYDWRLNGDAAPVSDRMRGQAGGARKKFVCPVSGGQPAGGRLR
jgi:soluble lytic murein transglycosylase